MEFFTGIRAILIFSFQSGFCQVYDDDLKPIGHPDEYLDLTQYDEDDLGQVVQEEYELKDEDTYAGFWKIVDNPIVPYEPIVDISVDEMNEIIW